MHKTAGAVSGIEPSSVVLIELFKGIQNPVGQSGVDRINGEKNVSVHD
jgi:hypothetical protein